MIRHRTRNGAWEYVFVKGDVKDGLGASENAVTTTESGGGVDTRN